MPMNLIGKRIIIVNNEFIEKDLTAIVVFLDSKNEVAALTLDSPLVCGNNTYFHAIASARLPNENFSNLSMLGALSCNVIWVPENKYDPSNPTDLNWWRGGAAAITDLSL